MAAADVEALRKAAEVICNRAKEISGAFSRRIPAATHVGVYNGMIAVVTDGQAAPNAVPFMTGNLHPLWAAVGSWRYLHYKWGKQPLRPYMTEAVLQEIDAAAELYGQSIYTYAIAHGFVVT